MSKIFNDNGGKRRMTPVGFDDHTAVNPDAGCAPLMGTGDPGIDLGSLRRGEMTRAHNSKQSGLRLNGGRERMVGTTDSANLKSGSAQSVFQSSLPIFGVIGDGVLEDRSGGAEAQELCESRVIAGAGPASDPIQINAARRRGVEGSSLLVHRRGQTYAVAGCTPARAARASPSRLLGILGVRVPVRNHPTADPVLKCGTAKNEVGRGIREPRYLPDVSSCRPHCSTAFAVSLELSPGRVAVPPTVVPACFPHHSALHHNLATGGDGLHSRIVALSPDTSKPFEIDGHCPVSPPEGIGMPDLDVRVATREARHVTGPTTPLNPTISTTRTPPLDQPSSNLSPRNGNGKRAAGTIRRGK